MRSDVQGSVTPASAYIERRRPGRAEYSNPILISMLRGEDDPPVEFDLKTDGRHVYTHGPDLFVITSVVSIFGFWAVAVLMITRHFS